MILKTHKNSQNRDNLQHLHRKLNNIELSAEATRVPKMRENPQIAKAQPWTQTPLTPTHIQSWTLALRALHSTQFKPYTYMYVQGVLALL